MSLFLSYHEGNVTLGNAGMLFEAQLSAL